MLRLATELQCVNRLIHGHNLKQSLENKSCFAAGAEEASMLKTAAQLLQVWQPAIICPLCCWTASELMVHVLMQTLTSMHEASFCHMDLTASNIMIRAEGKNP